MAHMTETALTALSQSIAAAVERAAGHVVAVTSRHSRASGFVWRPGLIVTADEALAEVGGQGSIASLGHAATFLKKILHKALMHRYTEGGFDLPATGHVRQALFSPFQSMACPQTRPVSRRRG